jgi:hypothetical protein
MSLTPSEIDALQEVFEDIGSSVPAQREQEASARILFREYLGQPGGGVECLPAEEPPSIYRTSTNEIAQWDSPFTASYAVDSGTTRSETYTNGLVLDAAKAKGARGGDGTPEVEELTTIVAAAYYNDITSPLRDKTLREGELESRIITLQDIDNEISTMVSQFAQKTAEGRHLERMAETGLDGPLLIDGSIYPMRLLSTLVWAKETKFADDSSQLFSSAGKSQQDDIVDRYVHAIDAQYESGYPLIGVVKTMTTDEVVRAVRTAAAADPDAEKVPWAHDSQFLSNVLFSDPDAAEEDHLTFTSWFVQTALQKSGQDPVEPLLGFNHDESREARDYRRAFFYVRLPHGQVFRIEAPLLMVDDATDRLRVTTYALRAIAFARDVPSVIKRADNRAKITQNNAEALKRSLMQATGVEQTYHYNNHGRFAQFRYD